MRYVDSRELRWYLQASLRPPLIASARILDTSTLRRPINRGDVSTVDYKTS